MVENNVIYVAYVQICYNCCNLPSISTFPLKSISYFLKEHWYALWCHDIWSYLYINSHYFMHLSEYGVH